MTMRELMVEMLVLQGESDSTIRNRMAKADRISSPAVKALSDEEIPDGIMDEFRRIGCSHPEEAMEYLYSSMSSLGTDPSLK